MKKKSEEKYIDNSIFFIVIVIMILAIGVACITILDKRVSIIEEDLLNESFINGTIAGFNAGYNAGVYDTATFVLKTGTLPLIGQDGRTEYLNLTKYYNGNA